MAYFIILGIVVFPQVLSINLRKKDQDIISLFLFIILFLFAALRGTGNGDYYVYIRNATLITSFKDVLNDNFPMEIGFRLIAYIVNILNFNPQWVLIVMNSISLSLTYNFIKKYSEIPILSTLIFMPYYFMFDMQAARTAPAIAISLFAFQYLLDSKPIKYILTILLASCFHKVALILLPMYLLRNFNALNNYNFLILILLAPLSYVFNFSDIITRILSFIGFDSMSSRASNYLGDSEYGYSFSLLDPRFLLHYLIYICTLLLANEKDNKKIRLFSLFLWLCLIITIVFRNNTLLMNRISSFFSIYLLVLVPELLVKIKNKYGYLFYYLSVFFIIIGYILYSIIVFRYYPEYIIYF